MEQILASSKSDDGRSLTSCRKQYEDFVALKTGEQQEQKQARLYYHASHWTASQLSELKKRGQPPTTTPLFARKVNGFVGLVERLRQDPKAYPRTGHEDQGAELCTAALRYALDQQEWESVSPLVTLNSAVDGIGGVEVGLEPGDSGVEGDYDISVAKIDPEAFFYDPRSFNHDFSDARFMGVAKWVDLDDARDMYPEAEDGIDKLGDGQGAEFVLDNDRSVKWVNADQGQIFVVEHWYKRGQKWLYKIYCGNTLLDSGQSYLQDEKGVDICRFIVYRSFVDQDGDSYSFFRNMRSLVDEINQRNSKALHLLSMRRIKMTEGAVRDVEILRREASRPDGVIIHAPGTELEFDDAKTLADMRGQLEMKQAAQTDLENFGPNPALLGQGVENKSGRAIALLQQAGIAELGPFILSNRNWKIRIYRAIWNAIKRYWTAERWIRVTDAQGEQQSIQINAQQVDPMTGMMQMVNQIGALDVDVKIDEGPDAINMQADALDVLQSAASQGQQIPPQIMIELLPLPDTLKKKLLGMLQQSSQPPPAAEQAQAIQFAQGAAEVDKTKADVQLKNAQAMKAMHDAQMAQPMQGEAGPSMFEMSVHASESAAGVQDTLAAADLKKAQTAKVIQDIQLAPAKMAQEAAMKRQQMAQRNQMARRA